MQRKILITGGAGFIGSHLTDALLEGGHEVRILDNLSAQVHGSNPEPPNYLNPQAELIHGDLMDRAAVRKALKGIDTVYHFAAMVGVGQSMYEIERYTSSNHLGTAILLQALTENPIEKLVIASSMSVYGEGLYREPDGRLVPGKERSLEQLKVRDWELRSSEGKQLVPVPTPEAKTPSFASIYALSKYAQERMCLLIGHAYGIQTTGLRFFNVYGPRQALSNPYTGVLAIFASRLLNGKPPLIFEDGLQQRDFVSVYDVVQACKLVLEKREAADSVFNIGSGRHVSIRELASLLSARMGKESIPCEITRSYRSGDIRHCFADITLARRVLGYEPRVKLEDGLDELVAWLGGQIAVDHISEAQAELSAKGLTV